MAVELISGYGDQNNTSAVQEAAVAGIHSVEKLMTIISQQEQQPSELEAIADVAMDKFKKVISLLDRPRTGHARFRKPPSSPPTLPSSIPLLQLQQTLDSEYKLPSLIIPKTEQQQQQPSAFKVYCPTPILRLPPLPQNPKKEGNVGIQFSASPSASANNSHLSSLTGDTESFHGPCRSSGFQMIHRSHQGQGSSMGKPPLSSSSLKRKCNSMDDAAFKCGSSSGRCHCSKKRYTHIHTLLCNTLKI